MKQMKELLIGKRVTAWIGENHPWIRYTNSNEGEPNYYKDFLSTIGEILYSEGESCRIEGYNEVEKTVTLFNEDINPHYCSQTFTKCAIHPIPLGMG